MTTQKSGLIVKGRTPADNHKLDLIFLRAGIYAEWNAREGYFFLPESENCLGALEQWVEDEIYGRDIRCHIENY